MKFLKYVGYETRNKLEHLGDDRLTPWIQDSFLYFLGPCLLTISGNNGSMDIHEIFRIWAQGATGYTVLRLNKLFHTLKIMHGGGLRSCGASCMYLVRGNDAGTIWVKSPQSICGQHWLRDWIMDGCVLLTSTPKCPVFSQTIHGGVDISNTHPSKFNPDYSMSPATLVNSCHNYAYDKQIKGWIEGNHGLRCQVSPWIWK